MDPRRNRDGGDRRPDQGWILKARRAVVMLHDLLWIPGSLSLAFLLRFGGYHPGLLGEVRALAQFAVIATVVHTCVLWLRGCYRGLWRYASLPDLVRLAQAVVIGVVVSLAIAFLSGRLNGFPRSILLLYPVILLFGLGAGRLLYRIGKDHSFVWGLKGGPRAVVVGAGRAGEMLVRDLRRGQSYVPLALLDDSSGKQGSEIHGVRVMGQVDDLSFVVRRTEADVVLFAIPTAPPSVLRRVVETCNELNIPCRTLPSMDELVSGKISVESLRAVQVEDLLGRDPVKLGSARVREWVHGRRVLVTGGGGSIGSELCRQLLGAGVSKLMIVDNSEFNLYRILGELDDAWGDRVTGRLVDVTHKDEMRRVFGACRPDYVFHAAAYKHVPLVEMNPVAGARVNVCGTRIVAQCASEFGASRFVLVSTDKAVSPTNVMGATKRVAELVCRAMNDDSSCTFVNTRFGNVLGSTGSVVPRFRAQINAGGPVTITHPEMRRFFMMIEEAASLILEAGASKIARGTFVLDMGKPIYIRDLAKQMIYLSGLEPERDVKIVYTGLRPGEKLYEELFYPEERQVGTDHSKLLFAQAVQQVEHSAIVDGVKRLRDRIGEGDAEGVYEALATLVPSLRSSVVSESPGGYKSSGTVISLPQAGGERRNT